MSMHVTPENRPDLKWPNKPLGPWVPIEMVQSDAFRSLSKIETDILLFILSRRHYPGKKKRLKGQYDYWKPLNLKNLTIPHIAVKDFFTKQQQSKRKAPSGSTITRALLKLMAVGFISLVQLGGNGKGDMSIYRYEYNWRTWREGDSPCFSREGMSREKGFCMPGSGKFCPSASKLILEKGSILT